jgi:outer membrane lipoprotein-sorting protein
MPWRRACLSGCIAALSWPLGAQPNELLMRIWNGVQRAQTEHTSGCGKITETRTSKLLAKPMVFRGKFCADGMDRFALEYTEPDPIRIRFDRDYLNVTTGGGKHTDVIEVGGKVRQTQSYFSKEKSIENLKKNFSIQAREDGRLYEMKLAPTSERFRRRLNYIVVRLSKEDFMLRSLEIDGTSGVNSVFLIDIASLDAPIPPGTFEVYRPK